MKVEQDIKLVQTNHQQLGRETGGLYGGHERHVAARIATVRDVRGCTNGQNERYVAV